MKQAQFEAAKEAAKSENLGEGHESEALRKVIAQEEENWKRRRRFQRTGGQNGADEPDYMGVIETATKAAIVVSVVAAAVAFGYWQLKKKTVVF